MFATAIVSLVTAAVAAFPAADVAVDATAAMAKPRITTEDGGRVGRDYYTGAAISIPCATIGGQWVKVSAASTTQGCVKLKSGELLPGNFNGVKTDYGQWH